MTAAGLRKGH